MSATPEESKALSVANTLAMVLIVALHYNTRTLLDWSASIGWSDLVQEVVVNGLARAAVPLFALMSAYFLAQRVGTWGEYRRVLVKRVRSLLIPYLLGAAFAYLIGMLLKTEFGVEFPAQWSWHDAAYFVFMQPEPSQYWFLRDLILLSVASPLLLRGPLVWAVTLTLACGLAWLFNLQPFPIVGGWYVLNSETLFFFCLGGLVARTRSPLQRLGTLNASVATVFAVLWLVLVVVRIVLEPRIDVWYVQHYSTLSLVLYKATILVSLGLILWTSYQWRTNRILTLMSGLTFFVYLYHMDPLRNLQPLVEIVVPHPWAFYVLFPLVLSLTFGTALLLARFAPKVFEWVNGGRSPRQALSRTST